MPRPLANIWDTAALPTAIRTMVGTVAIIVTGTIVTIGTVVIVTAVGAILATTRIVIVILTVVIAAIATAIGAGAHLLVVIRPIIASARVTPGVLPEAVAHLVQGTMTARMTALAGKFGFQLFCLCGASWTSLVSGRTLWRDKVEVLQPRRVSVSKSNRRTVPKFAFLSVHTTIVRKVSS
jgi:hypothetical protein